MVLTYVTKEIVLGKILVVGRDVLIPFYGVVAGLDGLEYPEEWFASIAPVFKERSEVETDPQWKQPIPYCLISRLEHEDRETQYFVYRRPAAGGESRLSGKLSIGVGGHVEEADKVSERISLSAITQLAARREIVEELNFAAKCSAIPLAMINHDDTEVGSVHFGIVYEVQVAASFVKPSAEIDNPNWMTLSELWALRDEMEGWSQMLLSWLRGRASV